MRINLLCYDFYREMEIIVDLEFYTLDGVNQHLSQLEHLKKLHIEVDSDCKTNPLNKTEMINLMVHSAGKVPNLQSFSYARLGDFPSDFVKAYAELYPHKKLTLNGVR
jgi:hypothetical protein